MNPEKKDEIVVKPEKQEGAGLYLQVSQSNSSFLFVRFLHVLDIVKQADVRQFVLLVSVL